jgi:Ribonuclease G/E
LLNHHRLRIIAPDDVDRLEGKELPRHPSRRDVISRRLEDRCLWETYTCGKSMALDHVKPDGRTISLSEGEIVDVRPAEKGLVLKRSRFGGRARYDGLGIAKQPGDYALSTVKEGAWYYTHTYFRRDGQPIGDYVNINTPVEYYPDRIRYIDLEIDVVRWPDGRVEIIDQGDLKARYRAGNITARLKNRALETAQELQKRLEEKGTAPFVD